MLLNMTQNKQNYIYKCASQQNCWKTEAHGQEPNQINRFLKTTIQKNSSLVYVEKGCDFALSFTATMTTLVK